MFAKLTARLCAGAAVVLLAVPALAETITVTDLAGRSVEVPHGAERIILGEGRMMYAIAPLMTDDPFQRILGWKDDLILYDPDAFRKFEARFPEDTARLVNFGNPYSGDFSVENVLSNKADLVILDLSSLFKARESGVIEKLEAANVPVIFIDFRQNATENTVPSLLLLGRVLAEEQKTIEFIDFYIRETRKISSVVQGLDPKEMPLTFLENAAGLEAGFCCTTYGPYNYGRLIELAGGRNYGSELSTTYQTEVSLEGVIAANPKVIVATGSNWDASTPGAVAVSLGYDATPERVKERLDGLVSRPGFENMEAVKSGQYHVIYHQFYNSPAHFVALQQIAKWLHPDEFADLDPQATWEEYHAKFMPFPPSGIFWATADAAQ